MTLPGRRTTPGTADQHSACAAAPGTSLLVRRDSSSPRRRVVDEESLPELQHHQRPEAVSMVPPAALVSLPQGAHRVGAEVPASPGPLREQKIMRDLAKIRPEPPGQGDREALLRPVT